MQKLKLLILLTLLTAATVFGQGTSGRLTGTVSGPDGALPGATVVATDISTGRETTVTANESGTFLFPQLEFGRYTVRVTATGFKAFVANELKIDVGREYSLNPVLEIGDIAEVVNVTAGADIVTSTSAQISNTVSPQQIQSLPLLARDPLDLITLQAGTQSSTAQNTTINGMRTSFTNITRDGINIQDAYIRTNATDFAPGRPTTDDTAEFTISTSNQEADQGFGGAQIRLVTPRGGEDFHGALFAYNRNSFFSANNFFSNRTGTPRGQRNRNQFGGKVSGPLPMFNFGDGGGPMFLKDKAFFFTNYEKIIDPISSRQTKTILTPEARSGIFRYNRLNVGSAINTTVGTANVTCPEKPNAATASICTVSSILGFAQGINFGSAFPNPNIPTTINPIIQSQLLDVMPSTINATGGDSLTTGGFTLNRRGDSERTTSTSRIDVDLTSRDSINGVFSWVREGAFRTDADTTFSETPGVSLVSKSKFLALAYRRIFSPTVVNEVRGGIFFSDVVFDRTDPVPDFFLNLPFTTLTNPVNNFLDQGRSVKNYNFQDNVDWVVGSHSLKFGGQIQKFNPTSFVNFGTVPLYFVQTVGNVTPSFIAADFPGGISSAANANSLMSLLSGFVVQGQKTFYVEDPTVGFNPDIGQVQPFRYSNHSLYFMDRWQARNNLTITGGVRWELFPALKLANSLALEPVIPDGADPIATILSGNGTYDVIGGNSGVEGTYYKTEYDNFAPQVGFAWAPKFKSGILRGLAGDAFVIRGGYSQSYTNDQIVTATDSAASANVGLASATGFARVTPTSSALLNLRLGDQIPPFVAPAFTAPPRTYLQNQALANNFGTVFAIDPELETTKIEQYSIGIQRELPGNMALEIRYVGTRSKNLIRAYDLNQVDIFNNGFLEDFERARANYNLSLAANAATPTNATPFCAGVTAGCVPLQIFQNGGLAAPGRLRISGTATVGLAPATFVDNLVAGTPAELAFQFYSNVNNYNNHPTLASPNNVPRINLIPNPNTGVIDLFTNSAFYNYNSLQIELRRRFTNGLYFQGNYTFSKNLTNAIGSSNSPLEGQSQFEPFLDINNRDLDRQRADFDQTHVFNFNGVYQLPFGQGKPFLDNGGWVDKVFGGFEFSGIVNWTSGIPITFVDPRGTLNRNARSTRQTPNSDLTRQQLQDLVGIYEANGNIYFIDPSIIAPAGTQGAGSATAGFGRTPFAGQVFFNAEPGQTGNLGRTQINGPGYFNVNMGLLKNIRLNETMRIQLRAEAFNVFNNVNLNLGGATQYLNINSATFGQATSATSPRIMQFAARFEF